jgi:hypothetical protein
MASVGHAPGLPAARATASARARVALGAVALAGIVFCSYSIAAGAAYRPTTLVPGRTGGFPPWLRGALSGLDGYLTRTDFATYVLVMCGCFLVAVACANALRLAWIAGATILAHVLFFLGPPLISGDVFGYVDWARMGALHGLNPYATDSGTVVSDPVYPFVQWDDFSSPYGPLFTLGTYALVPLGVPGAVWAIKLAVLAASLGCCALLWACARRLGRDPRVALALYGVNPAVLVYAVGGAHNDVLMMAPLLGGVYLALAGRERVGAGVASLAVAVKASAGLAIPFLVLGARDRRAGLTGALVAGAAVAVMALAAFGTEAVDFVNVLGTQQALDSGTSVIAQLGAVLGWHGNPAGARAVAAVAFVVALGALLVRTWRERDCWLESAGWATVALMTCTSWLLAWYIVWLVPLAALARSRRLHAAAVGMTLFVVLTRVFPILD